MRLEGPRRARGGSCRRPVTLGGRRRDVRGQDERRLSLYVLRVEAPRADAILRALLKDDPAVAFAEVSATRRAQSALKS